MASIIGGNNPEMLNGGADSDLLQGGGGNDTLRGVAGRDTFINTYLDGRDVITDFTPGSDRLDLSALGIGSFETFLLLAESARVGGMTTTYIRSGMAWDRGGGVALRTDRGQIGPGDVILASQTAVVNREATDAATDLFGGTAGDTLRGNSIANRLFGEVGYDTLTGGAGNDRLYGGAGIDTALFTGNYASYNIPTINGITSVRHNGGSDGTDILTGVERLQFADRMVTVATTTVPVLTLEGGYVLEGNHGSTPIIIDGRVVGDPGPTAPPLSLVYTVALSVPAAEPVRLTFTAQTENGQTLFTGPVTIAAGTSGTSIAVPYGLGNTTLGPDMRVIGTVSAMQGALLTTGSDSARTWVMVVNDDFQPGFSLSAYRAMNGDLDAIFPGNDTGLLSHYIINGRAEGRIAQGFDAQAYAALNPDLYGAYGLDGGALLRHYLTGGNREGRAAEGFDAAAYAALNPDLFRAFGLDEGALVAHFVFHGRTEGRATLGFSAEAYAALNPDLFAAYGLNRAALISHYITNGAAEGRLAFSADGQVPAAPPPDLTILAPGGNWGPDNAGYW